MESLLTTTVSSPQWGARFVPFSIVFLFCLFVCFLYLFVFVFFFLSWRKRSLMCFSVHNRQPFSLAYYPRLYLRRPRGGPLGREKRRWKLSRTGDRAPGMQTKRRQIKRKNAWNYGGLYNALLLYLWKRMGQPYGPIFLKYIYIYLAGFLITLSPNGPFASPK